jgi:hypothetical protein
MQLSLPWRYGQSKPFGSIPRINWSHPITNNLWSCILPASNGDPQLNAQQQQSSWTKPAIVGSFIFGTTPVGLGLRTNYGGTHGSVGNVWTKTSIPGTGAGDFTTCCLVYVNTTTVVNGGAPILGDFFGQTASDASPDHGYFIQGATPTFTAYTQGTNFTTSPTIVAGKVYALMFTRLGTACTFYINGISRSTGTSSLAVYSSATSRYYFGVYDADGTTNQSDVTILFAGGWNRALTATEAMSWAQDPYGFLIYPEDEMFLLGRVPPFKLDTQKDLIISMH